jgi:GDPmannose 4,6-dehydratase
MNTYFITGVDGQLGYCLSKYFASGGHQVIGTFKSSPPFDLSHCFAAEQLNICDIIKTKSLLKKYGKKFGFFFINCAGITNTEDTLFGFEDYLDSNSVAVYNQLSLLEGNQKYITFGSCEEFRGVVYSPQNESCELRPETFYGYSKVMSHLTTNHFRSAGLNCHYAILYPIESKYRHSRFLVSKLVSGAKRIAKYMSNGEAFEPIHVGNINTVKDWLYIDDFCRAVDAILEKGTSCEYIISSGTGKHVVDFINQIFESLEIDGELHLNSENWEKMEYCVRYSPKTKLVIADKEIFKELKQSAPLVGDNRKLRELGWSPKVSFEEMVYRLVHES